MARKTLKVAAAALAMGSVLSISGTVLASPGQTAQKAAKVPGLAGFNGLSKSQITKWKALIDAAKANGKLVVVSSHSDQETAYWSTFGSEFGINVQVTAGSPTQISTRILAERSQGVHAEDLVMAGGATMGRILNAGGFQPLTPNFVLPLLNRKTGWYYNKLPYCDSDPTHQFCTNITFTPGQDVVKFYYNTQLVSKKELGKIKSWDDLLQKKWKGKVVMQNVAQNIDPSDRQLGWALLGKKYWAKFMKQLSPTVLNLGGDVAAVNGLARGQWDFAFFIGDTSPYILGQQQGLPVAFFTKILKPGALPDLGQRLALMAQAPDQAAAQLYLNWSLTPEGQAAWNKYCAAQGDVALRSTAPRGAVPDYIWLAAIHTKKIYISADHLADTANSLAWWQQEMASLGIH